MTDVLKGVITNGTGKGLDLGDMPCAGKTGTTNDQKDGWFVGYTRYYTTSVWVGYDMPKKLQGLMGNTYPGKIWQSFMSKAHEGLEPLEFLPYARISDDLLQQQESGSGQPEDNPAEETPEEETPEEEISSGAPQLGQLCPVILPVSVFVSTPSERTNFILYFCTQRVVLSPLIILPVFSSTW